LDAFSDRVRALLAVRAAELPPRMQGFVRYLDANRLPAAYRERDVIDAVLRGLSGRLSRPNPLADALPALDRRAPALEGHFERFFPQLRVWAASEQARIEAAANTRR
jgi:acyl carrier protein phosphodiesterase